MSAQTEELLLQIADFVNESIGLLEKGAVMELAGLDGQVDDLCRKILALSESERAHYAAPLQELHRRLSELGDSIATQRDQVVGEISSLGKHRKASVAYASTESSDKK